MSKLEPITKQNAAHAIQHAYSHLHEASHLAEAANLIEENTEDNQCYVEVLRNVVLEKLNSAWDAVNFVDDYFQQKPAARTKRKSTAIVKAA
jgi:hypothetical protein